MINIFARSARKELQSLPMDVAADKTLSALSTKVPTSNQQALRATEKNYPTGFTGLCRISFSSGKR